MAAETQYTANTGLVQISTANSNLDGTGTLGTVLTASGNGTLIKSVTIKAIGSTTEGMIRFFINDGSNKLLEEIHVPANTPSATNRAFEYTWKCNLRLKSGDLLKASTQNAETFNIITDSADWAYFSGAVRPESTNYTANTGIVSISTANSNLDGTGTIGTVITAGSSATYNGCRIDTITIKAIVSTTAGMIRLFLYDTSNTRLFMEIPIPAISKSSTERAFEKKIALNQFNLKAGWSIKASTQNAENFIVIAEGQDWKYPASTYFSNFTPASGTNTTAEELLHSIQIPANVFSTGDLIQIFASLATNNNANNKTFKIYINTSNSLTAATQIAKYITSNVTSDSFSRTFPVISDTSVECFGGTGTSLANEYLSNTGTSATTTVPSLSGGFWVLVSGQKATGTDTDTIRWSMVNKVF